MTAVHVILLKLRKSRTQVWRCVVTGAEVSLLAFSTSQRCYTIPSHVRWALSGGFSTSDLHLSIGGRSRRTTAICVHVDPPLWPYQPPFAQGRIRSRSRCNSAMLVKLPQLSTFCVRVWIVYHASQGQSPSGKRINVRCRKA